MFVARRSTAVTLMLALGLLLGTALVQAQIAATNKISDVRGTKHNFSADDTYVRNGVTLTAPTRTVKATSETQVCVFCHTPHGATAGIVAPLWNRELSTASTYTLYTSATSSSIESNATQLSTGPGGSSKLCLSCHDGTMAIDKVNVLNGAQNVLIPMTNTGGTVTATPVKMPTTGNTTGFTRNLGTNLGNDHPISFSYDAALVTADGELRSPAAENTPGGIVMNRAAGKAKPVLPLESGQVQCATCHDPHLRDTTTSNGNAKFLRLNRFQVAQPSGSAFNQTNDIICIGCHDKGGVAWAFSAHANSSVATQTYKSAAANTREFPLNAGGTAGPPVWQVACLNCHDTHTVLGAKKLLREGTDNTSVPKVGGNAAQEETCYQCHRLAADSIVNQTATVGSTTAVPDIMTDFTTIGNIRMPITTAAQLAVAEVHDIGGTFNDSTNANCSTTAGNCGKDLLESRANLGSANLNNRHAECSDCHNPHRVIKYKDGLPGSLAGLTFNNSGMSASGTHKHTDNATDIHTNNISGVLRGSWGVEPAYPNNSFQSLPTAASFTVKRGDPGSNTAPVAGSRPGAETYVTREYQICLKCHSNYAYPDDNVYPNSANRPQLSGSGGTEQNANGHTAFTSYTNQAKEFQAPSTHAIPVGSQNLGCDGGAGPATNCTTATARNNNNHRSWHPVMAPTGRTGRAGKWIAPWNDSGTGGKPGRLGVQTMYCSDCHGSSTGTFASVIPNGGDNNVSGGENDGSWGPHGSSINFLLKGDYSTGSGEGVDNTLCFKCHDQASYASPGELDTGFQTDDSESDGHGLHANRVGSPLRCNWCHVAVPHGWKNRNLLVNLLDVGPEAGQTAGTNVWDSATMDDVGYSNGPYYRKAFLRVNSFPAAGSTWSVSDCNGGSRDNMRASCGSPN